MSGSSAAAKQQFKSSAGGKALDNARKQAASPVDGQSRKQQTQSPQPRAWQGVNPITQRQATGTPNGTEKPLPKLPAKTNGLHGDKQASERMRFLLANFTGLDAVVTLRSGEQYTGVFSAASMENASKTQYILKMAKRLRSAGHTQPNGDITESTQYVGQGADHVMIFDVADTVDLDVKNVSALSAAHHQNGSIASGFRTDTEISSRDANRPRERELQRWESGATTDLDLSLENSGSGGWDQFATNERLYGVQSTYDEDIYTISIDRNDPRYKQREARAAQIAREIESSAPANAHVAEERVVDAEKGDGLSEEDKYSGVLRESIGLPKRGLNSYVPPSQRPITSNPTVPGAPFDPAIVSMSKHAPSPTPPAGQAIAAMPTASSAQTLTAPSPAGPDAASPDPNIATETASAASASTIPVKRLDSTTEDHVRSTADAFRQFANGEKLRVRQAQEAKRTSARLEKNVKLNDLKKFAMNFKLNSRVPDDLVPILAKDREKQMEIQRKAEDAAKEQEQRAKDKEKDKTHAVGSTVSQVASGAAPTSTTSNATASSDTRGGLSQHSRARVSQQLRAPIVPVQGSASRGGAVSQRNPPLRNAAPSQPLPSELRIPTGPAAATSSSSMSPTSGTRLNVNAFEFRPSASNFTPTGASPSPQRKIPEQPPAPANFFPTARTPGDLQSLTRIDEKFDVIMTLAENEKTAEQKKASANNGGVPQPYRTPPTWPVATVNQNNSYKDAFPKGLVANSGASSAHGAGGNSHMPHAHQLPPHLHGPQLSASTHRPYYNAQLGHGQPFDPRMQQFAPGGSVQSSPRFPPAQMAFNGHMQPPMQMPQFAGQSMPGYHMSPSMQYRQVQVPGGGPIMMIPGQQHMPQMRGPTYPQGPQFGGPQMGGQMMVHNPSSGYMNGPIQQQPNYSPMPPHAQPHMGQMAHGGPGGYGGSPRPPMMQHSGSHQGFQPPMHMQQQPPYGSSPNQSHPYHLQHQQRQHSGNQFPQMTPRQQAAVPQHPSPGMGPTGQGDEGK